MTMLEDNATPLIKMDSLFSLHPKSKMWVQAKNGSTTPADIRCNNQSKLYWFHCDNCKHDFDSIVRSIVLATGNGCGYCSNKRRCPATIECDFCTKHSFASHPKAKFWSPKNTTIPRDWALSCNKKFWFKCDKKHEFEMTLNNISNGNKWCLTCGHITTTQKQTTPVEQFLEDAKGKFGTKFTYDTDEYVNLDTKITITCSEHGSYQQSPTDHMRSEEGCPKCGRIKAILALTYTKEEYLSLCNETHSNKYKYILDNYTNLTSYITVICPVHGEFSQLARNHLAGRACFPCGVIKRTEEWRLTNDEVIARARMVHGDTYIYDKFNYTTRHEHVIITCRIHGDFLQDPWNHLSGTGCKRCTAIYNTEDFVKKASEINTVPYDYSRVDYKNSHAKVIIGCPSCGFFEQSPNSHLCGRGCPSCVNKTQKKLLLWLKNYFDVICEFKQPWCVRKSTEKELRFDFLIKELNIIIELDGGQHFKQVRNWLSPEKQIRIDAYKAQQAIKNGYTVIRLLQIDVYRNPVSWLEEELKPKLHIYDEPVNMVIYDKELHGDIYGRHIALMEESDIDLEFVNDDELSDYISNILESTATV